MRKAWKARERMARHVCGRVNCSAFVARPRRKADLRPGGVRRRGRADGRRHYRQAAGLTTASKPGPESGRVTASDHDPSRRRALCDARSGIALPAQLAARDEIRQVGTGPAALARICGRVRSVEVSAAFGAGPAAVAGARGAGKPAAVTAAPGTGRADLARICGRAGSVSAASGAGPPALAGARDAGKPAAVSAAPRTGPAGLASECRIPRTPGAEAALGKELATSASACGAT